ncbi:MAG: hypothetical protein FIB02_09110 [Desulfuromonas sp.]|nr:hypothetical protein [Desulfuromonas sp.]
MATRKCIIHIGMHKTGSTSIQNYLDSVKNRKFVYAKIGKSANHSLAIYSIFSSNPEGHPIHKASKISASALQAYIAEMKANFEQAISSSRNRTLLISGEDISVISPEALKRFYEYLQMHFDVIEVVGYVRPPAEFMASAFQERVKGGLVAGFNLDREYCNYQSTFKKIDNTFGRRHVHLWKFDAGTFPDGCVVKDFCSRLGVALPAKKTVRWNESLSRQEVALLYTYRNRLGKRYAYNPLPAQEGEQLVKLLAGVRHDRFRFSPDLLRPILDKNRDDIAWMEDRLGGASLRENLEGHSPGEVRDEQDLLQPDPDVVRAILARLGDSAPTGVQGKTPEGVALLVHALRKARGGEGSGVMDKQDFYVEQIGIARLLKQINAANPELMAGLPRESAEILVRSVFQQINATLDGCEEKVVKYAGLGKFVVRVVEKEVEGTWAARTRIVFRHNLND